MGRVREIAKLLGISVQTAGLVLTEMEMSGLDFSECSQAEFEQAAREAYLTLLDGDQS